MTSTKDEIERGVHRVWRRMSTRGPIEVAALGEAERQWAGLLVRHRLAAVRSGYLTQLSRAADMANWEALSGRGLYAPRSDRAVTRDLALAEES
jgi:hypothetical protein